MQLRGCRIVNAHIEDVWASLNDPSVLAQAIPGCQDVQADTADCYRMTVVAGIASMRGTFGAQVNVSDQNFPHSFTLSATGSGTTGTLGATCSISLEDLGNGATALSYSVEANIGGRIGRFGGRILNKAGHRITKDFFDGLDEALAANEKVAA